MVVGGGNGGKEEVGGEVEGLEGGRGSIVVVMNVKNGR